MVLLVGGWVTAVARGAAVTHATDDAWRSSRVKRIHYNLLRALYLSPTERTTLTLRILGKYNIQALGLRVK